MVNLSEFVTGADSIAPEGGQAKDGTYEYEITAIRVQKGTKNKPNNSWILVEVRLDSGDRYTSWNGLPLNPNAPTPAEVDALRRYLRLLVDFGVPQDQANTFDTEQMIGWTGVLTLRTTTGKDGREYQNIARGSVHPSQQKTAKTADAGFMPAPQTRQQVTDPWAASPQQAQGAPASTGDGSNPFG